MKKENGLGGLEVSLRVETHGFNMNCFMILVRGFCTDPK